MSDRSGAGDAARTIALLWRERVPAARRRGPKPRVSLDALISEAIALADAEGLEALTMRRLAGRLGVAAMTIYTLVPGKAELLDLVLDALYLGMPRAAPRSSGWRPRLEAVAHDNMALCRAHPWLTEVSTARPPLGPGQLTKYEYELRALDDAGLDDVDRDAVLTFVLGFVESCARAAVAVRAARVDGGQSDPQWWDARAPILADIVDPSEYPTAARVGAAAGAAHASAHDPAFAFRFGLERVLDGVAGLVTRARRRKRTAPP